MAVKKEVVATINLQVAAGKANPAPPIGPALGQRGVNIMEFCKQFNAMKFDYPVGTPIPVSISVYKDKSFTFTTKQPPVTYLIKMVTGLKSGSKTPGKESAGKITKAQIREVTNMKLRDVNTKDVETPEYSLPETGGSGTLQYISGGFLLMLVSILMYIKKQNQERGKRI